MKTKRVLRYYCDFCRKSGCRKDCIEKHEAHCIRNPNRKCGMCELAGIAQKPFEELNRVWGKEGLEAMKDAANHCPACILSTIVLSRVQEDDGEGPGKWVDFDYKKSRDVFLNELNSTRQLEDREDEFRAMMIAGCNH